MNNILVVCAHSDDAVIGCGGTIKLLSEAGMNVAVVSVCGDRVLGFDNSMKLLGAKPLVLSYSYGLIDINSLEVDLKNVFKNFNPAIVFTHWKEEILLDHSIVSDIVSRLVRKEEKEIVYFEIPASSINFEFNSAFDISKVYTEKIRAIMEMKEAFTKKVFKDEVLPSVVYTPGFRGIQVGCKYAEVFNFYGRRRPLSPHWWALKSVSNLW